MRELLLASFGGIQYGIWRDEIQSIKDIKSLHRIPLGSKYIAGIMIDEDRPVMLADLPVCLGYESTRGSEKGNILLLSGGEELMGFAVNGELRTQTISTQLLFSLPEFLKTPVFDSCAVHGEIPIPIINTKLLYSRIMNHGEEANSRMKCNFN